MNAEQRIKEVLRNKPTSFTSLRYFAKLARVHTTTAQVHFDCDKSLYKDYLLKLERNRIAKHRKRVLLVEGYKANNRTEACESLGVCYATYLSSKRKLKDYNARSRKAA